jgi:hypothetical protein
MGNYTYKIKKGYKGPINITVRNRDEDKPINLTGSKILIQIKDELQDDFYIINKTVTEDTDVYVDGRIISPEEGQIIIRFNDEDYEKLIVERIYFLTIWWVKEDEDFAKVISSNCGEQLQFQVCYP